jgi:hypothetical protein
MSWAVFCGSGFSARLYATATTSITTFLAGSASKGVAVAVSYYPRLAAARRFRQSMLGAALHLLGILVLLAIQ